MPSFRQPKQPKPIEIDTYLGLNESVGETEIKLGEAVYMRNFRITNNFKVKKREGHQKFIDFGNAKEAYIVWDGALGSANIMLVANDGKIYEYDLDQTTTTTAIADLITEGVVTQLGTLTDAPTRGFYFRNVDDDPKIYIMNGTDFKEYDGTTYQDVDPYIPTILITAPPAGGGTLFEEINLLTGAKKQSFVGDGTSTTYQLAEDTLDSDTVLVTIDGVSKTENTHFTVNRTNGTVDFSAGSSPHGAPATDAEVIIQWVKVVSEHAPLVKKNKYFMDFGPGNDTNMFVWGNPDEPDRRMRSGILRADYWPINSFTLIGSGQFPITSLIQVYNRQLIFTEGQAFSSAPEFNSTTGKFEYPVTDLNERVGMVAAGQGQMVDNKPVTLFGNQIKEWASQTQIEDERNENTVSDKIKLSLADLDLSTAITFDYQKENEYWVNIGSEVYIWNYFNDTFYIFDNINANSFREVAGVVYYGAVGTVERFDSTKFDDNTSAYTARMELGFTDFGVANLLKNSRKLWIYIEPDDNTSVCTIWQTNRKSLTDDDCLEAEYKLIDYGAIDYSNWSYETNYNPEPFRFKIRAKKYAFIKFIFFNDDPLQSLTLLSMYVEAQTTGEVK